MNLVYWGFYRWPFQQQHITNRPCNGAAHDEALARLLFLVDERRRCGLLTGAAGTGKSRLLRRVKSHAQRQARFCLEIDATGVEADDVVFQITDQLLIDTGGNPTPARGWWLVQQQFASCALIGQPVVAVVEHLDLAERGGAQALRRLMNLAEAARSELTLLIAARTLSPIPLLDEVELSIELTGWSLDETAQFVEDSMCAAGATSEIFTAEAIRCVQDITAGIPGDVIRICDLSLLAAMSDDRRTVDATIVAAAAAESGPCRRLSPEWCHVGQPA